MIEGIDRQDRFTQFDTGAVRDIQEDKGRCDLAPLSVEGMVTKYWKEHFPFELVRNYKDIEVSDIYDIILLNISHYQWTGDCNSLLESICLFVENSAIWHNNDMYDSSIVWNLNTPICLALLDVSHHYKEGAQKYGERNWEKGIPLHSYIDSGVRHLIKFVGGYKDERHDLAFIWNMMGCIYTHKFTNNESLLDIPYYNDDLINKIKGGNKK